MRHVVGGDGRGVRGEEAVLEAMLGGCEETDRAGREAGMARGSGRARRGGREEPLRLPRVPQGAEMLGRCWDSRRR